MSAGWAERAYSGCGDEIRDAVLAPIVHCIPPEWVAQLLEDRPSPVLGRAVLRNQTPNSGAWNRCRRAHRHRAASAGERARADGLEFHQISDGKGKPVYDAFLYAAHSGPLFEAGTTTVIGGVVQTGVQILESDVNSREALQIATDAQMAARRR